MYSYVLYYNIEKSGFNAVSAYLLFFIACFFQCAEYGISLVQKGHFKIYKAWSGEFFQSQVLISHFSIEKNNF